MLALAAVWPLLMVFLQLILCEASQDSTTNRAKEAVAGLTAADAASETTSNGSTEATFAISGLFTALSVLLLILAVSSRTSAS